MSQTTLPKAPVICRQYDNKERHDGRRSKDYMANRMFTDLTQRLYIYMYPVYPRFTIADIDDNSPESITNDANQCNLLYS